jgi:hypothetical protein
MYIQDASVSVQPQNRFGRIRSQIILRNFYDDWSIGPQFYTIRTLRHQCGNASNLSISMRYIEIALADQSTHCADEWKTGYEHSVVISLLHFQL